MLRNTCLPLLYVFVLSGLMTHQRAHAEVIAAEDIGFQLKIVQVVPLPAAAAYSNLTELVSQWWLEEHTYTGNSTNLRMDLEHARFIENLPDGGFVRHMEIVYHQPGVRLTLSGGLGPLQAMGLQGAMTITFRPVDAGSEMTLVYNVSGYTPSGLKDLAPIVNQVLEGQLDSLKRFCEKATSGH